MTVDSFKYLPRLIAMFYKMTERQPELPIPWTPFQRPISECKFGLVTTGGLYHKGVEPPFDIERERREPRWGDPTFRVIPSNIQQDKLGVSHLHINTQPILDDLNVVLPIQRFRELADEGIIGGLAEYAYSFMGYQGFPPDASAWKEVYGPQVAEKLRNDDVNCVLLTPV
jgi:D-proline reductase (dithiol) PrdB